MSENALAVNDNTEEALNIVKNSTYAAIAAGIIPIPLFDFLAVTGIHLDLLRRLSNLYGIEFSKNAGKNIIGALTGGSLSSSLTPIFASTIKIVPVIGTTLGAVSSSIVSGATTYALGKVFIQHFASGGTFLTFDPKAVKEYYSEQLKEGKVVATNAKVAA